MLRLQGSFKSGPKQIEDLDEPRQGWGLSPILVNEILKLFREEIKTMGIFLSG